MPCAVADSSPPGHEPRASRAAATGEFGAGVAVEVHAEVDHLGVGALRSLGQERGLGRRIESAPQPDREVGFTEAAGDRPEGDEPTGLDVECLAEPARRIGNGIMQLAVGRSDDVLGGAVRRPAVDEVGKHGLGVGNADSHRERDRSEDE